MNKNIILLFFLSLGATIFFRAFSSTLPEDRLLSVEERKKLERKRLLQEKFLPPKEVKNGHKPLYQVSS